MCIPRVESNVTRVSLRSLHQPPEEEAEYKYMSLQAILDSSRVS